MQQAAPAFQSASKSRFPTLKEYLRQFEHPILQAHHRLCMATQKTGNDLEKVIDEIATQPFAPLVFALPGQIYARSYCKTESEVECMATDIPTHLQKLGLIHNPSRLAFCEHLRKKLHKSFRTKVVHVDPEDLRCSSDWRSFCDVAMLHHSLRTSHERSNPGFIDHAYLIRRVVDNLGFKWNDLACQMVRTQSEQIVDRALSVPPTDAEGMQAISYLPRQRYPNIYKVPVKNIIRVDI